jgi:hypothetical protein
MFLRAANERFLIFEFQFLIETDYYLDFLKILFDGNQEIDMLKKPSGYCML